MFTIGNEEYLDHQELKKGTYPNFKNFNIFNFDNNNLIITFKPYQVACYALGSKEVKIPFKYLLEKMDNNCILKEFVYQLNT